MARPLRQISTYEPGETVPELRAQNRVIDQIVDDYGSDALLRMLKERGCKWRTPLLTLNILPSASER